MSDKFVLRLKKWMLLFVILVVPYLIVQVVENATHKILSLGYLERTILDMDSLNNPYEKLDSARVPSFKLINQDQQYVTRPVTQSLVSSRIQLVSDIS